VVRGEWAVFVAADRQSLPRTERFCDDCGALDPPDFRTISDFRKRHLKALGALFLQVLKLCETAALVKLGHVALDGTKIKANASKHER
jgi:transposase